MSEAPARTGGARGRGGYRGGRGGYRGTRTSGKTYSKFEDEVDSTTSLEDQGEVGELKRKYGEKIPLLREVCPGWSDEDLVYALQETDGNVDAAVDRISSGSISQWGEVKKKPAKTKESSHAGESGATRGRGRGGYERARGRGTDRGARIASRGARAGSQANGTRTTDKTHAEAEDGPMIDDTVQDSTANGDTTTSVETKPTDEPKATPAQPAVKASGGWASLFAKPTPPPAPKKAPTPVASPQVAVDPPEEEQHPPAAVPTIDIAEEHAFIPPPIVPLVVEDTGSELPSAPHSDTAEDVIPSHDRLTEGNLEKLPDSSHPQASATAVSTVASTQDPLAQTEPSKPIPRPGMSGFAATALKATSNMGRSASYNRRLMEQHESVVMPANMAVEKTAVQFGKMGMNGDDDVDVDEDREEPETRTQLPDDSPVAPRASLPPAMLEAQTAPQAAIPTHISTAPQAIAQPVQEQPTQMATRPAPGLPIAPQQPQQMPSSSPPSSSAYTDPYRYSQGQKAYDPFGPQPPSASQEPFSSQVPSQAAPHAAPTQNDYASYYGRDAYQNYYAMQGYGQESGRQGQSHATSSQESQGQYGASRAHTGHGQESGLQGSGNETSNAAPAGQQTPGTQQQQPSSQQQSQQQQQHLQGQGGYGAYPYAYPGYNQQYPQYSAAYINQMRHSYGANRPMFDDVRREADYYGNQHSYGHNQQYGSNYKSNMYGQPGQQYSYEQHSSSPATAASFGGREGGYGRSGSAQLPEGPQHSGGSAGNSFGGMPDPFGRSSSGFGQSQSMSQQHGSHQGTEDAIKASGPSPSMQGGRPGSTTGQQGGLGGHQQSNQQGFGGYPQYAAGFGGFGGHQSGNQNSAYAGYGSNTGFGAYSGYGGGRGGWNGSNYGTGH